MILSYTSWTLKVFTAYARMHDTRRNGSETAAIGCKSQEVFTCMFAQDEELVEAAVSMAFVVRSCTVEVYGAILTIEDWQGVQ